LPHPTRFPVLVRLATPLSKSGDGTLPTQPRSRCAIRPIRPRTSSTSRRPILFLTCADKSLTLRPRHRRAPTLATSQARAHLSELVTTPLSCVPLTGQAAALLQTSSRFEIPRHRSEPTIQTTSLLPEATGSALLRFSCPANFVSRDFLGSCVFRATPAHANLQSPRRTALNNLNVSLMRPKYQPFVEQRPSSPRIGNQTFKQYYRIYLPAARQYRDF